MSENPRWKFRPPGSNWGDFGPDDERGRMNLVTAEKVRQGIAEVREGKTFCLSLPLDYPGGTSLNSKRKPPKLQPTVREGKYVFNLPKCLFDCRHTELSCDDAVLLHLQYSTQWDSFAHVGGLFDVDGDGMVEHVYYNGFRAGEDIVGPVDYRALGETETGEHVGAKRLGIEKMAETCVQGRGVMIDLHAHFGNEKKLVDYDTLMRVMEADEVVVEEGDMICLRTGFDRLLLGMNKNPDKEILERSCAVMDGRDPRLLQWITDSGLAAIICDNPAVEAFPSREGEGSKFAQSPLHEHCLFKLGVHLGEMFLLSDLADWLREHKRSRFLLTAPPLRLPGAVGSPTTAVATV